VAVFDQPDAGIWEYRGRESVHTYSSVMCWAACDRLARIATRLGIVKRARRWRKHADTIREEILRQTWNPQSQRLAASFGGDSLDASLLLLPELRFLSADDERFRHTMAAVESELRRGKFLLRYGDADDFGRPETAFTICTFWYIDALAAVGRHTEARELFEEMLACRTSLGLLSEDIHPQTHELWGNFPQTYSMVGIINTAMRLSKSWEEAL
jgi:pentatricopeptide repeat protein